MLTLVLAFGALAPPAMAADDGGAIAAAYQRLGGSSGRLGQPLDAIRCGLRDGGCVQHFQGGTIDWSTASGAHALWGAIGALWSRLGSEAGRLGYPLEEERCGRVAGGCVQDFQGGTVYWTPAYGAVQVWGAIRADWASLGWESGRLGVPVSAERCGRVDNGCVQDFSSGTVYWSPSYGAHPVFGAFLQRWGSLSWEWGRLGYPTSDERCSLRGGGCLQEFTGGKLYWSPATAANPVWGAIGSYWASYGWENGSFGYPASGENCNGSCSQDFWGGRITWNPNAPMSYTLWDWNPMVLVNKRMPLNPVSYTPPSLVGIGSQQMRSDAANALQRMINDAAGAGITITTVSGYRSYSDQYSLYWSYVAQYGQATADTLSARPGFSEHQSGLAMDIGNPDAACGLQSCFRYTPAGAFAADNAWKYGFIVRYPEGYQGITGYDYEPWHLRYVGADTAANMHNWGVPTLEQYFTVAAAPGY